MTIDEQNLCELEIRAIMRDYGITVQDEKEFVLQITALGIKMMEYADGLFIYRPQPTRDEPIAFIGLERENGETTVKVTRYDNSRAWN
jgi:hypothetical protein